ncbi:glucosaminidase domain-containing protein [Paenibacillus dendritiformis]|uniref:glucosaminidase domain-containing protein n=1 Tax=Paenibacillus dendritiformis TaxID=130049 RepID=UPI0036675E2B
MEDHSKLVLNGTKDKPTRYHGVLNADYKTACRKIWRGGYVTDPKYPQLLTGIIEQYGLMKLRSCRAKNGNGPNGG